MAALVAMSPCLGSRGGSAVTGYGYDAQDHLTSVTDAEGNTTSYAVSDRDLVTSEVSPVSGTTTHRYNDHGELIETTAAGWRLGDGLDIALIRPME